MKTSIELLKNKIKQEIKTNHTGWSAIWQPNFMNDSSLTLDKYLNEIFIWQEIETTIQKTLKKVFK